LDCEILHFCAVIIIIIVILNNNKLTATHKHLAALFNKLIEDDHNTGVVNGRSNSPYSKKREYRKSKELQTCDLFAYNIQTYGIIISRHMQKYMADENLMPKEQKGCCSRSKDAKISC